MKAIYVDTNCSSRPSFTEEAAGAVKQAFACINAKYGVTIEDEVQVGSHCAIYSVSTIDDKTGPVVLKRNCRIGSHSTVMPGVTIGENAVIGAHSFVTKNVPDNAVAYGVPAKVVKQLDS